MPNWNIFLFPKCCGSLKMLEEWSSGKAVFSKSKLTFNLHSKQNYAMKMHLPLLWEYLCLCMLFLILIFNRKKMQARTWWEGFIYLFIFDQAFLYMCWVHLNLKGIIFHPTGSPTIYTNPVLSSHSVLQRKSPFCATSARKIVSKSSSPFELCAWFP